MLGPDVDYLRDYLPSMVLSGLGVALRLPAALQRRRPGAAAGPQRASAVPPLQAVRQFGGTFGVALTIALLGASTALPVALSSYDRIWWAILLGGVGTALLALPLRTSPAAVVPPRATTAV